MTIETNHNHHWLRKWLRGEPHLFIGGREDPYLLRWYVIPRNHRFNIYLHKFCRSDDDRALHTHPWSLFCSLILKGDYWERLPGDVKKHRRRFSLAIAMSEHPHRVELNTRNGKEIPVWTLFITGKKVREWGFLCPQGFRHWEKFTDGGGGETVGRGCD